MLLLNPARFAPTGPTAYRYWRLYVTKWNYGGAPYTDATDGTTFTVAEMQFMASGVKWPLSDLYDYAAPSPYVVGKSSDGFYDGSQAWTSFDGQLNGEGDGSLGWSPDGLISLPHWMSMDLGSAVAVDQVKLAMPSWVNLDGDGNYAILSFQVKASNTGSFAGEEVTRLSVADLAPTGWTANTLRTFNLA